MTSSRLTRTPVRRLATATVALAAATSLLAPLANAEESRSPTGPIYLPAVGVGLDPLASGKREDVEAKSQPSASQLPYFNSGMGWFGTGFARPSPGSDTIRRVAVATGDGKVFVAAGGPKRVQIFQADSLASVTSFGPGGAGSPSGSWYSLQGITYNRGELYVLGKLSATEEQRVRVYDSSGNLLRVLAPLPPQLGGVPTLFEGIDAAWGELWVASAPTPQGSADAAGQQVVVLDAESGAIKGAARQPLSGASVSGDGRGWWDVSIAPEIGGAIVDRRVFRRGDLLPGLPSTDSPLCSPVLLYACTGTNQVGTDAPWGMRWFLELPSYAHQGTSRPVQEYSIDRALPLLNTDPVEEAVEETIHEHFDLEPPGHYLTPKRSWITQQQLAGDTPTLSDIAYNAREARIDWRGYLKGSDWLRGTQKCVEYVVSQADIYVVGDRGERWFELVDGFQNIELRVDGQLRAQSTSPAGQLCIPDIHQLADGSHSLELRANISGGRALTAENPNLRIDNATPSVTFDGPGPYTEGTVNLAGLITDAHSGVRDWALEVQPTNGSWRILCSGDANDLAADAMSCAWDTTQETDGAYTLRLRARDNSSDTATLDPTPSPDDDGNVGYSPLRTTFVDNTDPTLSVSGGLRDRATANLPIFEDERPPIDASSTDTGGSGVARVEVFVDGLKVDGAEQSCEGCSLNRTFSFDPTRHETGDHTVRVVATDRAGRSRETSWTTEIWRNPPDAVDESDTDQLDPDGADTAGASAPSATPTLGVPSGAKKSTTPPDIVQTREGTAIEQVPDLECDADDPYVVLDHLDYPAPQSLDLIVGTPNPDAAVAGYLNSAANLPRIPSGIFAEEITTDLERFYSVHIDGDRRAWILLARTETGGWRGNYFGACGEFVDGYFWASNPTPEIIP